MDIAANRLATDSAMIALRWLAGRCDWAETRDGEGFSGVDAPIGHALAEKSVWSDRETLAAARLIVKYRKQLETGKISVAGVDDLIGELTLAPDDAARRLRRRDVVSGEIRVDPQSGRIVVKLNKWHPTLVGEIKDRLLGHKWDSSKMLWTCDPCAENAGEAEGLASRYGLALIKDGYWLKWAPVRGVESDHDRVILRGVPAKAIRRSIPDLSGRPADDERVFRAIEVLDGTSISIPLRSWTIREAMLWWHTLPEDEPNRARLDWARDQVFELFEKNYPAALIWEREQFVRAGAVTLPAEQQVQIEGKLPARMSARLMTHQWVAVEALIQKSQVILADQQGLGKTVEILAALEATNGFPAIIIAPATALLNWRDEAKSWLAHRQVSVLGGGIGKRDQGCALADADLIVLNYESFAKHEVELLALRPKALVADEAQYLKGHASARTMAVKQFCEATGVGRIILATGTPVMNRPSELLTLLTLLPDLLAELGGFGRFASRYCRAERRSAGYEEWLDFSGAANLGELANRLRETGRFIRRDKATVLRDLPAKILDRAEVEISNRDEYQHAAEEFRGWLKTKNRSSKPKRRSRLDDGDGDTENVTALQQAAAALGLSGEFDLGKDDRHEALRQITALRRLAGVGKISAVLPWLRSNVKDQKLVIFAHHIEVQEALIAELRAAGLDPLSIVGDMTLRARQDAIERFQSDPGAQVIVCALKAAQTAITLTAARRALFVEFDWTPTALEQAEDRLHRIGQAGQVVVTYLRAPDTLDDRMAEVLEKKRAIVAALSAHAPWGYRNDGTPRKQRPGPGRPPLAPEARARRRKASKAGWQQNNSDYMRDYMRDRRRREKRAKAERAIRDFEILEMLGYSGMLRQEFNNNYRLYTERNFKKDLDSARANAEAARQIISKMELEGI